MNWHWAVPGPLEQMTGGYHYDAKVVAGLRARGVPITVHALAGRHPDPDALARAAAARAWRRSAGSAEGLIVDGLALPAFAPLLAAGGRRGPVIALMHHPLALETGLASGQARRLDTAERAALARVDAVVVASPATRTLMLERGVAPARIHVACPGTERPERRLPRPPRRGPLNLLCVATLTPRKGHLRLLGALRGARQGAWRLTCVGAARDGRTARRIQARRDRSGWRRRVRLTGEVTPAALSRHYRQADLFVFASHLEGYGMALAEALAYGVPVVTTRGGAIARTVPATAGLRVPGHLPCLRRALVYAIGHNTARRRWAAQARRHRRRLPQWDETTAVFQRLMVKTTEGVAHG